MAEDMASKTEQKGILKEPAERLPQLMNLFLIQLGKSFRDNMRPEKIPPATLRNTNNQVLPQIHDEFHEMLNEIEEEILKAKSIVQHELNRLRNIPDQQLQPTLIPTDDLLDIESMDAAGASKELPSSPAPASGLHPGISSADKTDEPPENARSAGPENDEALVNDAAVENGEDEALQKQLPELDLSNFGLESHLTTSPENIEGESKGDDQAGESALDGERQPDLESIFGEATNADEPNFDFDLDLTNAGDDFNNAEALAGVTAGLGGTSSQSQVVAANEDFNDLLPGLENYVDDDTEAQAIGDQDFSFDLSGDLASAGAAGPETVTNKGAPASHTEQAKPLESNKHADATSKADANPAENAGSADFIPDSAAPMDTNFEDNLFNDFDMDMDGADDLTMMAPGDFNDEDWQF